MPAPTITATTPCRVPPGWALWERALLDALARSVHPFLQRYTRDDGALIWRDRWPNGVRDGVDDFYESSYNWPLLYLLGGADELLPLAQRQWEAITRQLSGLGVLHKEYERGYDQFHQSEHYTYFYFLCRADPAHPANAARARRFAGLYLGEDPEAPNYDPARRIIRAPHNGSDGPRWGFLDDPADIAGMWTEAMRPYGLPFHDVPGIARYDDLLDPAMARLMGEVMQERHGRGDVAANLLVTSLVTNAFLMTGEPKYRAWVLDYVQAWAERAAANGGLLPDNVGLSGAVGEYLGGRWYGGLYGWSWPHGFYNLGMAAVVAASNAYLLSGDQRFLDLPRAQSDRIMALGVYRRPDEISPQASLSYRLPPGADPARPRFVVPFRHDDRGWFDFQPMMANPLVALWAVSAAPEDWARVEELRRVEGDDWRAVDQFRTKEDSGHERPWLRFLAGDNPGYPELILRQSYGVLCERLDMIRRDVEDLTQVNIHHWQERNPVTTEALVQLTLGAPQHIYNGGLLHASVCYADPHAGRPGLPRDVAALVAGVEPERVGLELVNLSPFEAREVLVQAGMFGEHRFTTATYGAAGGERPEREQYGPPPAESREVAVHGPALRVVLPPATTLRLDLGLRRHAAPPTYAPITRSK